MVGINRGQNGAGSTPAVFVLSLLLTVPLTAQPSAAGESQPGSWPPVELYFSALCASTMAAPRARRVTAWRACRFPKAAPWGQTLPESIPKWVRKA